jgi:biopolymer transport protein ExbD
MTRGLSRDMRRTVRRARRRRAAELNIVNMVDVLTVLIFFLLVNATGVSILGINLPSANSPPPAQPPRALTVIVRQSGLTVADRGGAIQAFPKAADGSYDLQGLATLLSQIKDRAPDEDKITLLLEPSVSYDTLVQVMDTVRLQPGGNGKPERELFPQISMGDAPPQTTAGGAP